MKFSPTPIAATLAALAFSTSVLAQSASQERSALNVDIDISLILEGVYYNQIDEGNASPAGFGGGHDDHDHGHGGHDHGFDDGFNMGHSELALQARLGDFMDGTLLIGFDDSDFDVEEAYLTTRSLPAGLQVKAGKFLSDIGYINSKHGHDWDFVDRPMVNEYLFGEHGLQDTGVQVNWLAPTASYTRLGVELLQGDQDNTVSQFNDELPVSESSGPRMMTAFAKFGPDLGAQHAAQYGLSAGYVNQYGRLDDHGHHAHGLEGDAWFAGLDAVYKYDAGKSYGHGNWKLASEYVYMRRDLTEYVEHAHDDHSHWDKRDNHSERQDGLYLEAVYGIAPRWEVGLRAEALGLTNDVVGSHPTAVNSLKTSYRQSAQLTFRPIEPVFLRAQLSRNDFAADGHDDDHEHDHNPGRGLEFMLQLNVALGAHGAHSF
ncbi:zinc-regulated TonB-dependent outer membrane receptor [Halopseudomonas salegens]|uniref:Zinc-regulated TonB-dependent outer membrane receptor n=1 Tax=Halopseudomonas salegens TaxID=1434072 RepID=A0A1H2FFJ9_9GAMM|nr:zinc-regulated TonB-dependent outer membrane receptor [Halopseudomonas salegens]SDU06065.1 hypothetical protein SAMN05216210_1518 [Halopseudomonas salegens]